MLSREIRQSFLDYFARHHHEIVRSSPLVPQNDPTLTFTNAGMVQFKDVFTGRESRAYQRATSSQKCVRAGGKHNDLENVGRTARHHTFFEMLGNFSFGDYFKAGAIEFAWEWLTKSVKLDPSRLVITVFGGDRELPGISADDEARALWKKISGLPDSRIFGLGKADNFWQMGDTGPQGPCSEIHYYIGDKLDYATFGQEPAADGTGWMEIWNLVFMQYEKATKDSPLEALPKPSIDTGAGLERVSAVVQGVKSNYDTDLLKPLVEAAAEMAKKKYSATMGDDDVSMRVLADHARSTAFLMADGVNPSNEGKGYVLRRIMRRAIRHGVRLGLAEGAFAQLCKQVVETMAPIYPELQAAGALIVKSTEAEDEGFRRTLDRGMKLLDEAIDKLGQEKKIPSVTVAKLYDTYGFPIDLTRVIAEERGLVVDEEEAKGIKLQPDSDFVSSAKAVEGIYKSLRGDLGATEFLGYHSVEAVNPIAALLVQPKDPKEEPRRVETAETGEIVQVIAKSTPFYGESGGQIGDTGRIFGGGFTIEVSDTQKPGGDLIVHIGKVLSGKVEVGHSATFTVDHERRDAIRGNHSATHLLHWALRKVLGEHVTQKGSLVAPDRLRFDFSHFQPMTEEEKRRVEDLVNLEVLKNGEAQTTETSFDEARQLGAMALFGEKYGDRVRVMRIGAHSVELCGGTHVRRSGDIGLFKLTAETGIAQGIRRIEAVTGKGALEYVQKLEDELARAAEKTRAPLFKVAEQIERLQKDLKERDKKIDELQKKMAMGGGGRDVMSQIKEVNGIKVLSTRSEVGDPKALREVADQLRNKIGSGVVVLGGVGDGKVAIVAAVTADLTDKYNAGKIVGAVSGVLGGKGGGRADMAQGGGPNADKLDEALESVYKLLS
jgi:alanyl-tRNA synthetase